MQLKRDKNDCRIAGASNLAWKSEKIEGKQKVPYNRIIVDADACPKSIREIITACAQEFSWEMITVASFNHQISGAQQHITVSNEDQAADFAVLQLTGKNNIVVTQDWGLAAIVLGKGAAAISLRGIIYDEKKIDFLLDERYIKAKFRRGGGKTKGPSAWKKEDDERFRHNLAKLMLAVEKEVAGDGK